MSPVHDYVIDNSTGANVRADINNVLQAILTNNSSSSAPSTTAAYMWWADTTNGVLKIRNSSNNDWVELLQLDGTLTLEDGSASSPALGFRDDLNTGIFSGGADEFNISTGGTERFVINSSGNVGIGTLSPNQNLMVMDTIANEPQIRIETSDGGSKRLDLFVDSSSDGNISAQQSAQNINIKSRNATVFIQGGTSAEVESMRLDSSGRLLIGTTTEGFATADDFTIAGSGDCGMTIRSGTSSQSIIAFSDATSGSAEFAGQISYYHSTDEMVIGANTSQIVKIHDEHINVFAAEGTSRVNLGFSDTLGAELSLYDDTGAQKTRICGSSSTNHFFNNGGNVGIGLNNPAKTLDILGGELRGHSNLSGSHFNVRLKGQSSTTGGAIIAENSAGNAGPLLFYSGGSNQAMTIDTAGAIRFGTTSDISGEKFTFFRQETDGAILAAFHQAASSDVVGIYMRHGRGLSGFSGKMISFRRNDGTEVGSVTVGVSSTAFNTSSDYRLKENVTAISDGITRLKTLKPYRFNFKDDTTKPVVDGFFAHEVTAVPEAITGTKDQVDANNNPIYQSIDQSKLVPLLVAAVQELITKVETLEAA